MDENVPGAGGYKVYEDGARWWWIRGFEPGEAKDWGLGFFPGFLGVFVGKRKIRDKPTTDDRPKKIIA